MRKIKKEKYKRIPKNKYLKNANIEIISLNSKEAKQILDSNAYSDYLKQSKNNKNNIISKAANTKPIRVLYKKANQPPVVKTISNIKKLKKAIIEKNLQIIPYENLYIVCNNQKQLKETDINIVFEFSHIAGDLILVDIDKNKREFKNLNKEDIEWYTTDLINKSFKRTS